MILLSALPEHVSQSTAEAIEPYLHHVAVLEPHAFAKTECIRAEEVYVHVARAPVSFKFEMMMFNVGETMRHYFCSGLNRM
jgi:hypothetical protein